MDEHSPSRDVPSPLSENSPADARWDEPLLADDLEQAYLRALEATDSIDREIASESSQQTVVAEVSDAHAAAALPAAPSSIESNLPRVTEKQVVEAALFVGGPPLTAKKMSSLLHSEHEFGFVECLIDELNRQYADESRPYSITLGEGGYRLSLLPEFESVRNKVFGFGPKEVKLAQDALEVLALVAYRQPITKSRIEELGKDNAAPLLRQLLQRELIRIDRAHAPSDSRGKSDPPYVTTLRFLSLFGIGKLSDLPQAEDFDFK